MKRDPRAWIARFVLAALVAAAPMAARAAPVEVDSIAVRWSSPETGSPSRPRFITRREVACLARLEGLAERLKLTPGEYPERLVRTAIERHVARSMLAALWIQRGTEPPDLPKLATVARAEMAARVGGAARLEEAMKLEGISNDELDLMLRARVRAGFHVDRAITPIFRATEESLREAHRAALHPFRGQKFEDCRDAFRDWYIVERQRAAETEFFQGARARVRIVYLDERAR